MGKKKKAPSFEIIAIIDKSGSMAGLTKQTIDGFNGFLKEQQAIDGEARLTLVLFSGDWSTGERIKTLYENIDIQLVAPLTEKTYIAQGGTPLYDAIGQTLSNHVSQADKTVVFVITDGYENASTKWSGPQVRTLIENRRNLDWEFIFLGANIEKDFAYGLGFDRYSTYTTQPTGQSVSATYARMSDSLSMTRSGISLNVADTLNEADIQ